MSLTTTVEFESQNSEYRLYNSLKIRTYTQHKIISSIVNELCKHRIHVEKWHPKAGQHGLPFDIRRVSIAGRPMHGVVRLGRSPITNLHLGNRRGDFELLQTTMGSEHCERMDGICRKVATRFAGSHVIGIDLLATPYFRDFYVLELNAFGDLLPGILYEGRDTYETEILFWKSPAESCISTEKDLE